MIDLKSPSRDILLERCTGPLKGVEIVHRFEQLTGEMILSGEDAVAIVLRFTDSELWVHCLAETDEVYLGLAAPECVAARRRDLSNDAPWPELISGILCGISWMENDRGYQDAVQFSFCDEEQGVFARIQLEGVASGLHVWRLLPSELG